MSSTNSTAAKILGKTATVTGIEPEVNFDQQPHVDREKSARRLGKSCDCIYFAVGLRVYSIFGVWRRVFYLQMRQTIKT